MNFGEALQALKDGFLVKRSSWSGYWYLAKGAEVKHDKLNLSKHNEYIDEVYMDKMIVAILKDDGGAAPAQPYQSDLLAEDWQTVE